MTTIFDTLRWNDSPVGYWTIKYEYQRNDADMQYRFYWKVWLPGANSWYNNGLQLRLFLNGVQHNVTVKEQNSTLKGWSYEGTTEWYTVPSKYSGTTPFYASLYDTNSYYVQKTSSSYSLATSPCPAVLSSVDAFNDESNPVVKYSNPAGNDVDSLQVCISLTGYLADVPYREVSKTGTSYTFMLTEAERNVLRNATTSSTSREVIFVIRTFIDGEAYTHSIKSTVSIVNANPIFDASKITYADTNATVVAITGNNQHIVQNKSSLSVTVAAGTGNKGASIISYEVAFNERTITIGQPGTVNFGAINLSDKKEVSVTVVDSRGNRTTANKDVIVLPYAAPIVDAVLERLNNYEDTTYFTPKVGISSVDNKNTVTVSYKVKRSDSEFGEPITIQNNVKRSMTCNNQYAFIFSITATDKFETVTKEFVLSKGRFPLFIDTEKNAVGVNEFPGRGEALRVSGGVACFDDGIVLKSANKSFKITIDDNGAFVVTQLY